MRSGTAANDAVRCNEISRAADGFDAAREPRSGGQAAYLLIHAIRGQLAEYGNVECLGAGGGTASLKALNEELDRLPVHALSAIHGNAAQLRALTSKIDRLEGPILARHRKDETSRRLDTIPGSCPIAGSAIAAPVPDASLFRSGGQFAAWLGLTPRPDSSGGKEQLGERTKQREGYLRRLLVVGATAIMRMIRKNSTRQPWIARLIERKATKIATVALANNTARIALAVMTRKEAYAAA